MASRFSAARPSRAGEDFARTHHNDDDGASSDRKRVKFDVRNPSTLAPDAREEDAVLDADVIGAGSTTKRGAVNLDGYDSDSDNDTFDTRAAARKTAHVNILEQLDQYDARSAQDAKPAARQGAAADDDDEDEDMFAANVDDESAPKNPSTGSLDAAAGRKRKDVRFLDASQIQGQESESKSGGRIELHDRESSDDDSDKELAMQEEGLDEEVGAGGLKRNAPRVEAFNLREEMEEGRFDQDGTYLRKAEDPDTTHDKWLDGLSKKDMRKAAAAHERREKEAREQRIHQDSILVSDILRALIIELEKAETPLEALARLGRQQTKPKKVPKWKQNKKSKGADAMDAEPDVVEDPAQTRLRESINAITDAADKLLSRDFDDIYDQERELLIREYARQTGEEWVEPKPKAAADAASTMWEFRWCDGRDGGATQGPFDAATMKAWEDAGYFEKNVEFRHADGRSDWARTGSFG